MSLEIEGKLFLDLQTQKVSDSFKKREFVVVIDEDTKYPQYVKFELSQDKCAELDKVREGQNIVVHFNLRGREWNGKYFTNLNAWRIQAAATTTAPPQQAQSGAPSFPTAPRPEVTPDPKDDLPF
jgi:single-strand DNA-binding protein